MSERDSRSRQLTQRFSPAISIRSKPHSYKSEPHTRNWRKLSGTNSRNSLPAVTTNGDQPVLKANYLLSSLRNAIKPIVLES